MSSPKAETLPGDGRDQRRAQAQEIHEAPGQQRAGAAEGDQRVVARIEPALDGHLLDGVGLVPGRDLEDALGRALGPRPRRAASAAIPSRARSSVERDLAAQQVRRDATRAPAGVGHRRLGRRRARSTSAGVGARAARSDLEPAVGRDPGDGAAAGADGDDVDHRHLDREPADGAVGGEAGHPVLDEADVGAGAARVGGEHAVEARGPGEQAAPSAPAAGR